MDLSPYIEKNSDNFKLFSAIPEGRQLDPDPDGSKTFCRIWIRTRKKSFLIRAAPDPKWRMM